MDMDEEYKEQVIDEMRKIACQFGVRRMAPTAQIISQAIDMFDDLFIEDMANLEKGKIEPPHAAGILVGMALHTETRIRLNDMESKH